MVPGGRMAVGGLVLAVFLAGCAVPTASAPAAGASAGEPRATGGPKRVVMAIIGNAPALNNKFSFNSTVQGADLLETLVSASATTLDPNGVRRPQLAESVPSIEDGSWKTLPDGRMETTWRIKQGATWHDGAPLTADDLLFTLQVGRDKELPLFSSPSYAPIADLEALDDRTVLVRWTRPYIDADALFTTATGVPLPRHLLGQPYQQEKDRFTELAYWNAEFVGTGAFKLHQFIRDSHVALEAFDGYVHGRPKLDRLEVRFIAPDIMAANILAGSVELFIGRGFSIEQAIGVRDQWPGGRLEPVFNSTFNLYPQLLTPDPQIIGEVQFRRALRHAMNQAEIAEVLTAGMGIPIGSFVKPTEAEYDPVQPSIVAYPHDPRRAMDMVAGLGYSRGADGVFRSQSAEPLALEVRTLTADLNQKAALAVVDYWRRVGLDASLLTIPRQRQTDGEWRANFPGFQVLSGPANPSSYHSSRAPLPSNNYQVTGNYVRYLNPEYDALADRYYATIPRVERTEVLRQIVHWVTDQVLSVTLFAYAQPTLISNRLKNVTPGSTWNLQEWDVS